MKVRVELMTMGSEAGYAPSSGYTEALLVNAQAVADCMSSEMGLWGLDGYPITEDMLEDCKISQYQNGACIYDTIEGIFSLADGEAVVQREQLDISTNSGIQRHAWIVEEASLKTLYLERAAHYRALADNLSQ